MVRIICIWATYFVWPLGGFAISLKKIASIGGYCSFILFTVFLNLNMILREQDDIWRYIESYRYAVEGNVFLLFSSSDFYFPVTAFLFSQMNLSPVYLFVFWSIVYYTGFYLCLVSLLKYCKKRYLLNVLLVFCAIMLIEPSMFSAIRYFTGAYYFIYFCIRAEIKGKGWRSTIPLWIAPFMHFMYLPVILAYYLYRYTKINTDTLFTVFIISWLMSFVDYSNLFSQLGLYSEYYYLSETRATNIDNMYNYGRYLYLPMQLSLWLMIFMQYQNRKMLDVVNLKLLRLSLFYMIFFNLVSISWDFTVRFRPIMEWLAIFSIIYYYNQRKDRYFSFFLLLFPVCFLGENWDFLFVSGPAMFDFDGILFSNFFSVWDNFVSQLNKI